MILTHSQRADLRLGAELIRQDAEILRECHTTDGAWPEDSRAEQLEYQGQLRVATALEEIAELPDSLPTPAAGGPG